MTDKKQQLVKNLKEIAESAKSVSRSKIGSNDYFSNSFKLIKGIFSLLDGLYAEDFETEIDLVCLLVSMEIMTMDQPNALPFYAGITDHCMQQFALLKKLEKIQEQPKEIVPYLDVTNRSEMPKA